MGTSLYKHAGKALPKTAARAADANDLVGNTENIRSIY